MRNLEEQRCKHAIALGLRGKDSLALIPTPAGLGAGYQQPTPDRKENGGGENGIHPMLRIPVTTEPATKQGPSRDQRLPVFLLAHPPKGEW